MKTIKRAAIGFLFGTTLGTVIVLWFSFSTADGSLYVSQVLINVIDNKNISFLLQTVLTGATGMIIYAGFGFYDIEHWDMIRSGIVHFTVICPVIVLCVYALEFISDAYDIMVTLAIIILLYFSLWLCKYEIYKKQVERLNVSQNTNSNLME